MPWTATPITVEAFNGRVLVEFADGITSHEEWLSVSTPDQLKARCASRIATLNDLEQLASSIVVNAPLDLTPVPVNPKTPEEQAKIDAQADKFRLAQLQQEVDLKIRKPDNSEYVALVAKLSKAVTDGVLDVAAVALP